MMKALYHHSYGTDGAEIRKCERPEAGPTDIVVRVAAAAVNPLDLHTLSGVPRIMRMGSGWRQPSGQALGVDLAGTVVEVGDEVTQFVAGDEVVGMTRGAFAEYVAVKAHQIVAKPAGVDLADAAALPAAASTAIQALRTKGGLEPGQAVLVNGASGGVGTFTVQIAKALGASVTAVCSTRNVELVRSLGADTVVDYTTEDFTALAARFDVLVDNVGNRSLRACRKLLVPTGTYVAVSGPNGNILGPLRHFAKTKLFFATTKQTGVPFITQPNQDDLAAIAEMVQDGTVMPVIDRRFDLDTTLDAMAYLGEGHAQGKVLVDIDIDID